jgi:hypothetical protein
VNSTSWLLFAPTTGLGGRSCSLRVTAEDPVSGRVYISDYQYLIKA